ncbi:aconitase X catalytic domain-containing protein [Myxococcota bacterium]|nr:aconitase X catalytic domain-containing protein [Myxococcota bacterium]MBU1381655.1 aconitase X catalytic domain-containing protein [Myxococcota bacterium]MBU1497565.1 aconitase X catalytic domain-containing protein [Myxococcota bacterium]
MSSSEEFQEILNGDKNSSRFKAASILQGIAQALGEHDFVKISSAQISGVSVYNLGPEGVSYLKDFAVGTKVRVKTTLNPGAFDIENPPNHIPESEVASQKEINAIYGSMGVSLTLTCSPYLSGNLPLYQEHLAWSESSAVTFANSVCGARTNRESGMSALCSAVCGFTVSGGLHMDENRQPGVTIRLSDEIDDPLYYGLLGVYAGRNFPGLIPLFDIPSRAGINEMQALSASIITWGGASMFHIFHQTPEWNAYQIPTKQATLTRKDLDDLKRELSDDLGDHQKIITFTGCPHRSAGDSIGLSEGKSSGFITAAPALSGPYSPVIMAGGCVAVSKLKPLVTGIITDSVKAAFYLRNRGYKVKLVFSSEIKNNFCPNGEY